MDVRKVLDLEDDASTVLSTEKFFLELYIIEKDLDNFEASSNDGSKDENEDSQSIN
jgi:hypothetical protein